MHDWVTQKKKDLKMQKARGVGIIMSSLKTAEEWVFIFQNRRWCSRERTYFRSDSVKVNIRNWRFNPPLRWGQMVFGLVAHCFRQSLAPTVAFRPGADQAIIHSPITESVRRLTVSVQPELIAPTATTALEPCMRCLMMMAMAFGVSPWLCYPAWQATTSSSMALAQVI